jgi:hypothetical protein
MEKFLIFTKEKIIYPIDIYYQWEWKNAFRPRFFTVTVDNCADSTINDERIQNYTKATAPIGFFQIKYLMKKHFIRGVLFLVFLTISRILERLNDYFIRLADRMKARDSPLESSKN